MKTHEKGDHYQIQIILAIIMATPSCPTAYRSLAC
eukprot:COSAG06_NODE_70090_length_194_cov_15.778947_1_plen_34_part_01